MRTLLIICFSALIFTSQAVYESGMRQGSLFTPEKLSTLERSPIGRAIIHLAELSSHVKGDFDFNILWTAIDELADGLKESRDEENELFEQDQSQYQIDQQFYSNQINQFNNEVSVLKVDLEDLVDARSYYEETLGQKSRELSDTQQMETSLQNAMVANQETFTKQGIDYDNAITVIEEASDLLSQVRESSSFLQHDGNTDRIAKAGSNLKLHLSNLDKTRRVFYQPIIKLFVQMASQGFTDQQLLVKVLSYLEDLRQSLIDNKQSLITSYGSELAINVEIIGEYADKIENLGDVIIPQNQVDIATKIGEISTKNILLTDAATSLQDGYDSQESTEERWLQRQNSNRNLIDEYNNDLAVVNEATNALQRGGIVRR